MASSLAPLVHACTQLSTFYDSLLAHLRVIDLAVKFAAGKGLKDTVNP